MTKSYYIFITILVLLGMSCKTEEPTLVTSFVAAENTFGESNANNTQELVLTIQGTINEPVSVNYTWQEFTAFKGTDFNATDGTLEFSPDQLTQTVSFEIIGDEHLELEEIFTLSLTVGTEVFFVNVNILDGDNMEPILSDSEGFYTEAEHPSMRLIWSDEFEGTQLNTDDWTYELGDGCDKNLCGWGNNELQEYSDAETALKVENGRMTITARSEGNNKFSSARIITQDKVEFTFGRIDIRAKMPKGQGIWPALWMLGANIDQVSWPACGEIDIMELVGHEPATTHGTVHYNNNGYATSSGSKTLESGDLSDQFHVYSIVWEENRIRWFLDNENYKTFAKKDNGYPFNAPEFFIMNIAIGGNWPGNPDNTTVFPQTMEVDYIRVFQ